MKEEREYYRSTPLKEIVMTQMKKRRSIRCKKSKKKKKL